MANGYYAGMLQHTIVSNISAEVMPKIDTGNGILNTFLSFFVMSSISYIVTVLNEKLNFINCKQINVNINYLYIRFICNNQVELEFSAKNTGQYYEYSDCYLAIVHYINTIPDISSLIKSKEELKKKPKWFHPYFDDDDDDEPDTGEMYSKKDIMYRITQNKKIHIDEHIYCCFYDNSIEKSEKNEKNEYHTVNIKCLNIKLTSTTKDINYLQSFVDKLYTQYIDYKNESTFKGKMYFSYEGQTDKKKSIWKEFPWHTNKTYDNLFLENKEMILGNIKKLTNMKDFNKRIGRPNQMNILIWGNDYGCGKTSLLKAICNIEFPDRHIVNINLNKIKTCKELEDIFINPSINGRKLKIKQCIFIIDEIEKCCPVLLKENNVKKDKKDYSKLLKKYADKFKIEDTDDDEFSSFFMNMKASSCDKKIQGDSLNLGFILSLMDGPIEYPERVMIFTANDKDKLHPAFVRPGRIDIDIHLKKATVSQIIDIISFIFEYDLKSNSKLLKKLIQNINDYDICPSVVYEACLVNNTFSDNKDLDVYNTIEFIINKIN